MRAGTVLVFLLVATMTFGWASTSNIANARTFSADESASFLAKVQEIPVETHSISVDIGNSTLVQWHTAKLQQYWTAYDTSQIAERNQSLANEISASISNLTGEASKAQPSRAVVNQTVANLDRYLIESIGVRVDQTRLQNDSVSALAIKFVLDEAVSDYGNATRSSAGGSMNMSAGSMSNMSMSSGANNNMSTMQLSNNMRAITNFAAYQSAEALANVASSMWNALKAHTPSGSADTMRNLDNGFAQLIHAIDSRESSDQLMIVLHGTIHPDLIALYNLQIAGHAQSVGPSILEKKRIDYLSETSSQRHSEHLALNAGTVTPYTSSLNYLLDASGTVIPLGGTNSSTSQTVEVKLFMSIFRSTTSVVSIDVMNGSVTTGNGDMRTVQSGFAYYLPIMHKLVVFGYIPQKQGNSISSVQLVELWCTMDYAARLPSSSSDSPLGVKIWSPESKVGSDWEIQASGQLTIL